MDIEDIELKNSDYTLISGSVAPAPYTVGVGGAQGQWYISPILAIGRGTGPTDRVGRLLTIRNIEMKGTLYPDATETLGGYTRIMLVLDKQANGTQVLLSTDIFEVDQCISPMNLSNANRFVKLLDITTDTVSGAVSSEPERWCTHIDECLDTAIKVTFNGSAVLGWPMVETNNVYLCFAGAGFIVGGFLDLYIRFLYTDY